MNAQREHDDDGHGDGGGGGGDEVLENNVYYDL